MSLCVGSCSNALDCTAVARKAPVRLLSGVCDSLDLSALAQKAPVRLQSRDSLRSSVASLPVAQIEDLLDANSPEAS